MGEKQSGTPLATPGAATTPFTFTHGKRGTEHFSEKCHGLAGELTVRSSRLARWAPPLGQSVVQRRCHCGVRAGAPASAGAARHHLPPLSGLGNYARVGN